HAITRAGFPHSDTLGSQLGWQLPEAYRSLLRPSSALGAKAATVCSYTLTFNTTIKDARVHCAALNQHTPTPPTPTTRRAHRDSVPSEPTPNPHSGPTVLIQTPNLVLRPDPTPPGAGPEPTPRDHRGSYAIVFHPMSHPAHHTRARTGRKL